MQTGPTVINTSGGENLQIPKTTTHTTAASAAQAAVLPSADPAFALATLGAYKYGDLIYVARELLDDEGVDLVGYLAMSAGRALGNKFGSDLVTGTGTEPADRVHDVGDDRHHRHHDRQGRRRAVRRPGRPGVQRDRPLPAVPVVLLDRGGQDDRRVPQDPGRQLRVRCGSRRRSSAPRTCCSASRWWRTRSCRRSSPVASRSRSATSAQFFVRLVGGVRFERSDDFLFSQDLVAFQRRAPW